MAFRDRTIKYNFVGAPPEWMQAMQEVFSQWQAEIARQYAPPPGVTPGYSPQPQPQQWNSPPIPQQPGYMSPQMLPNSPMSSHSSMSPPMASPNLQPAVFAHHASAPQFAPVEMMGDLPPGAPTGGMLVSPPPVQSAPPEVSLLVLVGPRLMLTARVEEETVPFQDVQLIAFLRLIPLFMTPFSVAFASTSSPSYPLFLGPSFAALVSYPRLGYGLVIGSYNGAINTRFILEFTPDTDAFWHYIGIQTFSTVD